MHFSTIKTFGWSLTTLPREQCQIISAGPVLWVCLEVIDPGVGITLKKTKLVTHRISLVNALESEYNSWSCCSCDNFEGIITSGNNDPARKTWWFQSRVLVCISTTVVLLHAPILAVVITQVCFNSMVSLRSMCILNVLKNSSLVGFSKVNGP